MSPLSQKNERVTGIFLSHAEVKSQFHQIFKGVGMELALRSILPVEAFIQLRMAAHRGFFPFPVS